MDSDRINRWLTLLANLGVLVGVAILVFEIRQSQNIALAGRENEQVEREFAVNELIAENVTLVLKMNAGESLSADETMIADRIVRSIHMAHFKAYTKAVVLDARGREAPIRVLAIILHENSGLKFRWRLRQDQLANQLDRMNANTEVTQSFTVMVEGLLAKLESTED